MSRPLSYLRIVILLGYLGGLSACQTTTLQQDFQKLKVGMEKPEVLNIMGSPDLTRRWHGQDQWTYYFSVPVEDYYATAAKEVHFQEGKSVHVGDPIKPTLTAQEQDRINERQNIEIQKKWEQFRRNKDKYGSVASTASSGSSASKPAKASSSEPKNVSADQLDQPVNPASSFQQAFPVFKPVE